MSFLSYLATAGAEVTLAISILTISILDMFIGEKYKSLSYYLSLVALAVVLVWLSLYGVTEPKTAFSELYITDHMAVVLKQASCVIAFFVFLYSREYLQARDMYKSEFYLLALYAVLGIFVLISGNNLITLYLGLELLALSQYGLVAFRRDDVRAAEAAMKYFVLGAVASGILLYGMSMLYGMTGTLSIAELSNRIGDAANLGANGGGVSLPILFALAFIVAGVAFKLGAVPFHMWLPDVYEGSPTAVTTFIASVPKFAAFALTYRLLVDGLGLLQDDWVNLLIGLAFLSMLIGNIVAISQTNVKRMLAYSTISHVGFILLGFIAGTDKGYEAALFYTLTYVLTAAAGFGLLVLMSKRSSSDDKTEIQNLTDLNGLNQRNPWLAFLMLCVMFGMAGVPPFVGFHAKLAVIAEVIDAGHLWLGIAAVLFSVIGAYYYLRVVKHMYFDAPSENAQQPFELSLTNNAAISINALAILLLGLLPALVWPFAQVFS